MFENAENATKQTRLGYQSCFQRILHCWIQNKNISSKNTTYMGESSYSIRGKDGKDLFL